MRPNGQATVLGGSDPDRRVAGCCHALVRTAESGWNGDVVCGHAGIFALAAPLRQRAGDGDRAAGAAGVTARPRSTAAIVASHPRPSIDAHPRRRGAGSAQPWRVTSPSVDAAVLLRCDAGRPTEGTPPRPYPGAWAALPRPLGSSNGTPGQEALRHREASRTSSFGNDGRLAVVGGADLAHVSGPPADGDRAHPPQSVVRALR